MKIADFRKLSDNERMDWVGHVIVGQNPRLKRGADMVGPVDQMVNGHRATTEEIRAFEIDGLHGVKVPAITTVCALIVRATPQQVMDYHPWLDIDVGKANWLHLYDVKMCSDLGADVKIGDSIKIVHKGYAIDVPVTQKVLDDTTWVTIRYALS